MKDDRDIILSSKELYTQKKIRCNSSFNLISLKCGTSVKNYLSNSFYPACILIRNKNKALYRFLIDLKKFVKLLNLFQLKKLVYLLLIEIIFMALYQKKNNILRYIHSLVKKVWQRFFIIKTELFYIYIYYRLLFYEIIIKI